MIITIQVDSSELRAMQLTALELEEIVWDELVNQVDPYEMLNVNLDIVVNE